MPILCRVTRGELTESIHVVFAVVVNESGIIYSTGDPNYLTCVRSALKPFQAATAIKLGAVEKARFSIDEIALMCASHLGEEVHVKTAQSMLEKLDYNTSHYECGSHYPSDKDSKHSLIKSDIEASPLHNNCSGKHAGMLSIAKFLLDNPRGYIKKNHPVQKAILNQLKEYAEEDNIPIELDGCSAPTPFLTLEKIAHLYQKLSSDKYPELIECYNAMRDFPYNVAGKNQFDTKFIEALNGRGITKGGGESIRGVSLKSKDGESIGIALKVLDGHHRAMPSATIGLLKHLNLLSEKEIKKLNKYEEKVLRNHRNIRTGKIEILIES